MVIGKREKETIDGAPIFFWSFCRYVGNTGARIPGVT